MTQHDIQYVMDERLTYEPGPEDTVAALAEQQGKHPREVMMDTLAAGVPLSFASWQALLNNFAIERAAYTGVEIGILQSLREVPGFLAFTTIFVLLILREQTFALISLALLCIGTATTET